MNLGAQLRASLQFIAGETDADLQATGYNINKAIEVDKDFDESDPRSSLLRAKVRGAVRRAASREGSVTYQSVRGNGRELVAMDGDVEVHLRLRKAIRTADGELWIPSNSASATLTPSEPDALFQIVDWVLAWVVGEDDLLHEMVAAPIVDAITGNPGRLVLGPEIALLLPGVPGGPGIGFTPDEEDDEGFGEETGTDS